MKFSILIKTSTLMVLALILGSCSEEGLNEFAEASMTPNTPYLVFTDTKFGSGEFVKDIAAPWFFSSYQIENKHPSYYLMIPSLAYEYKGYKDGKVLEGKGTFTADDACSAFEDATRTIYAVIPPSTVFTGDAACDFTYSSEQIIVTGLPKDTDGKPATTYQVKVIFEGYFYDPTAGAEGIKGRVKLIRYYMAI